MGSAMKILYLVNGIRGSGGLERVLLHKASHLAEHYGHKVRILVLNESPGRPFYAMSPLVEVVHFRAAGRLLAYLLAYRRGVRRALMEFEPGVVSVCDDGLKGLLVPLMLPRSRPPLVYERHASLSLMQSGWQRAIARWAARLFDQFVLLTRGNLQDWRVPGACVIPNPLPEFVVAESSPRQKQVLCVGTLSHNKGYDLLIDAWSRIAGRHPDWAVHVYGHGDPGPYQEMAATRGIEGRIAFHAPVADISARYLEASLFVLPSRSEGFGMVLIEAMSCGLPCISFDCPSGPGDILSNGEDGVLVAPQDAPALARAIDTLIGNPEQRERLGRQARVSARRYEIGEIVARWHALFSSLVARNA